MAERININRAIQQLRAMNADLPRLIANDALNHFKRSFRNEGFTDQSLEKWPKRKRLTARDRRRIDRLKARGKKITSGDTLQGKSGRALLVLSGKMRRALKKHSEIWQLIRIGIIGIPYAGYHNRGADNFKPMRKFIGESKVLNDKITKRIRPRVDKFLKSF